MKNKILNNSGFSFAEMLVSVAIFMIIMACGTMVLMAGQQTWSTSDTNIHLQSNMRQILSRVSKEVQETGTDTSSTLQMTLFDNTGINSSDIIRFSIPVCVCSTSPLDGNTDVAYWGAPMYWGNNNCGYNYRLNTSGNIDICHLGTTELAVTPANLQTYLDQDAWYGDCTTCNVNNNKFIQYSLNSSGQLIRRVLTNAGTTVREDVFAHNVTDMQASLNAGQDALTLTMTLQRNTNQNRSITLTESTEIFMRNVR